MQALDLPIQRRLRELQVTTHEAKAKWFVISAVPLSLCLYCKTGQSHCQSGSLQDIAEQLQASISRHSQLAASTAPLDLQAVLKYAHKIAYTSFAPLGHDHTQPLPQHFRPPKPQQWQLRASQLHQFQGHSCYITFMEMLSLSH